MAPKILGISGSLRNILKSSQAKSLIYELKQIESYKDFLKVLELLSDLSESQNRAKILGPLVSEDLAKVINDIKKYTRRNAASNSEIALLVSLWEAARFGIDIDYCSLKNHFPADLSKRNTTVLSEQLIEADAILISGPVYFGDRSSLVDSLIRFVKGREDILNELRGVYYGGVTVGAKRNGGQETALIYQVMDLTDAGLVAVGNDSETTCQYGGTCVAGNPGTLLQDKYGLETSKGTGRRLAKLLKMQSVRKPLTGKLKVAFLILKDANGIAKKEIAKLTDCFENKMEHMVVDISKLKLLRCLACDKCPKCLGDDVEYRCSVGTNDDFSSLHEMLIDWDAIIPVCVSVKDLEKVNDLYQVFMERTRYLRRGDYVLSDVMISPLIFKEVGVNDYSDMRLVTSLIRHQTVISKSIIGVLYNDIVLNSQEIYADFELFIQSAVKLAESRLSNALRRGETAIYNPVGYILKSVKDKDNIDKRKLHCENRVERMARIAEMRLKR